MERKIAIVVPCFNTPKELMDPCIESIHKAMIYDRDHFQLFICDDASTKYQSKYTADITFKDNSDGLFRTRLRIIKELQKNYGYSPQDYILFVDSDDLLSDDFILNLYNTMKEHPDADMYSSYVFEKISSDLGSAERIWMNTEDKRRMPGNCRYLNGKVIKMKLFDNAMKEYDKHHIFYGEDSVHFCYYYPLLNSIKIFKGIYYYINRIKSEDEGTEYRNNEAKMEEYQLKLKDSLNYVFDKYPEVKDIFKNGTDYSSGVDELKVLKLFNCDTRYFTSLLSKYSDYFKDLVLFVFNDREGLYIPSNFKYQLFINCKVTPEFIDKRIERYGRFRRAKSIKVLTIDDLEEMREGR